MLLFLVRHGQTYANLEEYYSGQSDVALTPLGKEQAAAIAPILADYRFDRVYSSDLSRAVDTAALALPGCSPIRLPLLREVDTGAVTGHRFVDIWAEYGHMKGHFKAYGGEDPEDTDRRAAEFLSLLEAAPCTQAIAFTHNGYMKAVVRQVLGRDIQSARLLNGNCNIAVLKYERGSWSVAAWNLAGAF